jgi:succinate dehydrogenase / fumarate reductase cytochrome b subunit
MTEQVLPRAFIWRRLHSLCGLWLTFFLIIHLLTNSQAALLVGNDGEGFIHSANSLEALPFLPFLEMLLLGFPIAIHTLWGIKYLRTSRLNSYETDGSKPALPEYSRNRAFTWQRITAAFLIFALIGHIIHMRFIERPESSQTNGHRSYIVRLSVDEGLYTLAERLNFKIYDTTSIQNIKKELAFPKKIAPSNETERIHELIVAQEKKQNKDWLALLEKKPLKSNQVIAVASNFGTADLLMLRDTFKSPTMIILYTLFVLTAVYHAFNGLWTGLIKWGVTLNRKSQRLMLNFSIGIMIIIGFLGLAAVWGTYWINLKN